MIEKIESMKQFYGFRTKTDLVNSLLIKHYSDMMKGKFLETKSIYDELCFQAQRLVKEYNLKYSYGMIGDLYYEKYGEKIHPNTLIKIKTKFDHKVKQETLQNIVNLFNSMKEQDIWGINN